MGYQTRVNASKILIEVENYDVSVYVLVLPLSLFYYVRHMHFQVPIETIMEIHFRWRVKF